MVNILGISAFFHDAACCTLQNGELTAAAEEERFSRMKFDPAFPVRAIKFCLQRSGIDLGAVDCVAFYEKPFEKFSRQLWMLGPNRPFGEELKRLDPCRPETAIREELGFDGHIEYVDHHLSHAASSFYFSGFPEAAVLTVDGVGEWATTTYGSANQSGITFHEQVCFPDSIGLLYNTLTSFLGFEVNEGEYKVMGLAPYGRPIYTEQIFQLIESSRFGQYRLNLEYFDFLSLKRMYSDALPDLFGAPPRQPESEISQFHMDVARSLQYVLEELLLEKVEYLHGLTGSDNLCIAGGVALNCVANSRIRKDGPFRRLFIHPAANDAGGCIGAAALGHLRMTGKPVPQRELAHVYLGPEFDNDSVCRLLEAAGVVARDHRGDERQLLASVSDHLAAGRVVGWFHGRMEFGPRALGGRSILADPRDPRMREYINNAVKKREAFRPFAPAVLEKEASGHFDIDHSSPFMLETCQVQSPLSLPSITHVDGTARVQTVSESTSPRFARLLREFERRTGCPILLNTSFNVRGEPIVCTPADALNCFANSGIDVLVIEDFVLERSDLPSYLFDPIRMQHAPAVTHDVYTFV